VNAKGNDQMKRRAALLGLLVLTSGSVTWAQTYPSKPVRIVVPFTPGGSTDILARAIGNELSKSLGQSFVIENVPGAGGGIGADKVAKSAADGHTLLMGHIGTLAVNPSLYPNLPYQPLKDFAPVAWVARVPNVLVVNKGGPAHNLKELIALAKSRPGYLNYSTGGNGSAAHLATEYFKMQTGTSLVHIPLPGRCACGVRRDRRSGAADLYRSARAHGPHSQWPVAGLGGVQPQAAGRVARCAHRGRGCGTQRL
jgi:tripartite-type tricarboxylate transporter receptor subunit TctC